MSSTREKVEASGVYELCTVNNIGHVIVMCLTPTGVEVTCDQAMSSGSRRTCPRTLLWLDC